jgi:hypothetical protein
MGKHEQGYTRVDRDFYPTPSWVIDALAEHVELQNRRIWECAAGDGRMARTLAIHGARVFSSNLEPHASLDAVFDFLSPGFPEGLGHFDGIITNSKWGHRNRTAVAFIENGLRRIAEVGGFLALLLPTDFDSAVTRLPLFQPPFFAGRVILTDRPVWFERTDGVKAAPKENCAWFVWSRPVLRDPADPVVRYAVARETKRRAYDAQDDVHQSVLEGFRAIRRRKAAGGPGWIAGGDVGPTNKIIPVGAGGRLEVHRSGRLELHRHGRSEWVDRDYIHSFWPEITPQIDEALVELP